jgi:hypothetical protein
MHDQMTIGVSHDLETGDVVLIDAAAKTIEEFSPSKGLPTSASASRCRRDRSVRVKTQ